MAPFTFSSIFFYLLVLTQFSICNALTAQEKLLDFQNPELPITERIEDLISKMTPEEKAGQLMFDAEAIPRLGIPRYNWWSECLHGVARNGRATVFPQAIGLAATFDTELISRVASAIADEARAKYNATSKFGDMKQYQGLTFWTPNINIFRDPRWGRGQETYGEDPYLTSRIGVAFVKGLQGDHPEYVKAAACAKHYAVHSGPEGLRHQFNAVVSRKDLWETYLPAFEALVTEAKVEGVMGAYNRTNGDPCCAHPYLMQDVLRQKWGFNGYFVSDCWALTDFYRPDGHRLVNSPEEAGALALKAGCNLNCGATYLRLLNALDQSLISEEDLDRNLKQLLGTRFRLGLFDPAGSVPFDKISTKVIRSEEHIRLAKEAAIKSMVLLKNKENTLPLAKDIQSVYVCGPTATHMQGLLANYYGLSENMVTILEGIVGEVSDHTNIRYSQGALLDRPNLNPQDWFSGEAGNSDVTIACLGISQLIEGEEGEAIASPSQGDRMDIRLPQNQIDFLKTIRSKAKKLVVVLTGGSAIACPGVYEMADALLYVWYPGEQGGAAVADLLFGDAVPSGRLPVTFPKAIEDLPPYDDYSMMGRTYRYMDKEPLFPFGFGLSYTQFQYNELNFNKTSISPGESIIVSAQIQNRGNWSADEVVQLYISDLEASVQVPKYSLIDMQRIHLSPNESKTISFEISPGKLELVDENGNRKLEPGVFQIYIGGTSPDPRNLQLGGVHWLESRFEVH